METDKESFILQLTEKNEKNVSTLLQTKTVGIAGCGGVGSNVAAFLTRAGIKRLILVDFDKVSVSNLNRQFYFLEDVGKLKVDALEKNLLKINPYLEVDKHPSKLCGSDLFKIFQNADVLVEAFDGVSDKSMLINAFLEEQRFAEKYLVCASGLAGLESSNSIKTVKYSDRVFISGDLIGRSGEKFAMSPRVSIVAAHQANMVVRILAGIRVV